MKYFFDVVGTSWCPKPTGCSQIGLPGETLYKDVCCAAVLCLLDFMVVFTRIQGYIKSQGRQGEHLTSALTPQISSS